MRLKKTGFQEPEEQVAKPATKDPTEPTEEPILNNTLPSNNTPVSKQVGVELWLTTKYRDTLQDSAECEKKSTSEPIFVQEFHEKISFPVELICRTGDSFIVSAHYANQTLNGVLFSTTGGPLTLEAAEAAGTLARMCRASPTSLSSSHALDHVSSISTPQPETVDVIEGSKKQPRTKTMKGRSQHSSNTGSPESFMKRLYGSNSHLGSSSDDSSGTLEICSNCGSTDSNIWRQIDYKRVCNACGVYHSRTGHMRPAQNWGNHGLTSQKLQRPAEVQSEKICKAASIPDVNPNLGGIGE
eukprot:Ihof_evm1s704 gene=Ihof_evmTU1s704